MSITSIKENIVQLILIGNIVIKEINFAKKLCSWVNGMF